LRGEVKGMLYRTLKRMIERGQIEGMEEKLDIFLASSKITAEEYTELMGMLPNKAAGEATEE
jgi:hypothetical protein